MRVESNESSRPLPPKNSNVDQNHSRCRQFDPMASNYPSTNCWHPHHCPNPTPNYKYILN